MAHYTSTFEYFPLIFKKPAGTSRGILLEKPSWFLKIRDRDRQIEGIGECSIIPGLSTDDEKLIENKLEALCSQIYNYQNLEQHEVDLKDFPAIKFALETAITDLRGGGKKILYNNPFTRGEKGITINGLIWMGAYDDMMAQAKVKVNNGYKTLKFKVGAIDFESELKLIQNVRQKFGNEIDIRLDANGAFTKKDVFEKLDRLSKYRIHSIEQPVKAGNPELMQKVCNESPVPVALDEELIGIEGSSSKTELLNFIMPRYIILKPSLLGGIQQSEEWITIAENIDIQWWATSALESNIGLNAIAQWVAEKDPVLPQGLGTGGLYVNNVSMPLKTFDGKLWFI